MCKYCHNDCMKFEQVCGLYFLFFNMRDILLVENCRYCKLSMGMYGKVHGSVVQCITNTRSDLLNVKN